MAKQGWGLIPATYWNWRGRINRVHFLFGLVALMFVTQFIGAFAFFLPTFGDDLTSTVVSFLIVMAPIIVFLTSLVTQRAHDIGWSAKWPLAFLLVTLAAFAVVYIEMVAFFLGQAEYSAPGVLFFVSWGLNLLWTVIVLLLIFAPGQQGDNRFGPPPRPIG